ncbi:hypothetical protein ALC62_07563, partial [Cyphomyrmex costatus]
SYLIHLIANVLSLHVPVKLFSATTRKTGVSSLLSRRPFSRDSSTMICAGRKSSGQVTHGSPTYMYTESNRIDGKASLRRSGSCPLRETTVIYRYVKRGEAGYAVSDATFESAVRLRTCHFCHEVINKRHPVPSPELRD